ncbi:MAG: TonB-dependent receptor, partial [Chitinophagaceae bacterium]|nr:TonB-dependent receptor [Chitinophagaceae bacterium]
MRISKTVACITATLVSASSLLAQDTVRTLNEVIITATKYPLKERETGKVLTVINQEQIQKNLGKSIPELLNQQAGITINGSANNLGTNQTVYLQGAASANTLILLDGVPLYDASGISSEFDLNNFSLYNIERIEILKGAQSTLYGADAVAGVINIITKKSGNKPFDLTAIISGGSYDTYKGAVALSGTNGKGQTYFLSYNKITSKGFSSASDTTGKGNYDRDGFEQDLAEGSYNFKPGTNLSARIYGKYNVNHADIDAGAFIDDKNYTYKNKN